MRSWSKARPAIHPREKTTKDALGELAYTGEKSSNQNGDSTNPVDVSLEGKGTAPAGDSSTRELANGMSKHVTAIDPKNSSTKINSIHGTKSLPQRLVDQTSNSAIGSTLDPLQRHPSRDNTQVTKLRPVLRRSCKRMSAYGLPPSPDAAGSSTEITPPRTSPDPSPGKGKHENEPLEEGEIQD